MNLREEILREHSKAQAIKISDWIGNDQKKFAQLMKLFFANEYRVTQRAAFSVAYCFQKHSELILPYLEKMIDSLAKPLHVAVIRNTVRILQFVDIPPKLQGKTADNCFNLLTDMKQPVAIHAFSMGVLANICEKEPDLAPELKMIIEDLIPHGSSGIKSRGNKILKRLNKLKK